MKENKWYKTTVEISFQLGNELHIGDFSGEEEALNWLCPENIAYALRKACENTNFTVKKVD